MSYISVVKKYFSQDENCHYIKNILLCLNILLIGGFTLITCALAENSLTGDLQISLLESPNHISLSIALVTPAVVSIAYIPGTLVDTLKMREMEWDTVRMN